MNNTTIVSYEMIKKVFEFGMLHHPDLIPIHNGLHSVSASEEAEAYVILLKLYLTQ